MPQSTANAFAHEGEAATGGGGGEKNAHFGPLQQTPEETHAFPLKVVRLGEEPKGLGEGEAEVGLLTGNLVADGLAEAPPPVGELELDCGQLFPQTDEVGDPSVERDLGVNLHPLPLQEPCDDGAEVRFLHGKGGEERGG